MWFSTSIYHSETAFAIVFSSSYVLFAGTKRHLQPLDACSGLLLRPKCICDRPEPHWWSLQRSPDLLAGGEGSHCPSPRGSLPLPKNPYPLSAFGPQKCTPKTNSWLRRWGPVIRSWGIFKTRLAAFLHVTSHLLIYYI